MQTVPFIYYLKCSSGKPHKVKCLKKKVNSIINFFGPPLHPKRKLGKSVHHHLLPYLPNLIGWNLVAWNLLMDVVDGGEIQGGEGGGG